MNAWPMARPEDSIQAGRSMQMLHEIDYPSMVDTMVWTPWYTRPRTEEEMVQRPRTSVPAEKLVFSKGDR
eukprot:4013669-Heterocapsa_arctica.AAC.1